MTWCSQQGMMKYLLAVAFTLTSLVAVWLWPPTCEESGGRIEILEPVGSNPPTKVCVLAPIEVTRVAD